MMKNVFIHRDMPKLAKNNAFKVRFGTDGRSAVRGTDERVTIPIVIKRIMEILADLGVP
jgi:hypothetical protein